MPRSSHQQHMASCLQGNVLSSMCRGVSGRSVKADSPFQVTFCLRQEGDSLFQEADSLFPQLRVSPLLPPQHASAQLTKASDLAPVQQVPSTKYSVLCLRVAADGVLRRRRGRAALCLPQASKKPTGFFASRRTPTLELVVDGILLMLQFFKSLI